MSFIVLLNQRDGNVMFLRLSDEQSYELLDKYKGDVEAWIAESDLEDKFDFEMCDCNYMLTDEMPEIFGCDVATGQKIQLSLFS